MKDVTAIIVTRGDVPLGDIIESLPYPEILVRYPNTLYRVRAVKGQIEWEVLEWDLPDEKIYGRYSAIAAASHPWIYFQDDDVIFRNHEALYADRTEATLVTNMDAGWIMDMGYYDMAMVGLGAIAPRDMFTAPLARFVDRYGESDDFLLYCDVVVGALVPWRRADYGAEILPVASAPNRLWQGGQPHLARRAVIMNNARELRTVVLTLMVKNESDMILEAIESAQGLFDTVLVMDTGSTDDTVAKVADYLVSNGIDGEVLKTEWKGMGPTRNEMLELARTRGDYQLLMDADELFDANPKCWPTPLFLDAYVLHYAGPYDVGHPRLIYSNHPWEFRNIVHGALYSDFHNNVGTLDAPLIVHRGDNRSMTVPKMQTQVDLLTDEIAAENDVPRQLFHRAKAYEGMALLTKDDAYWDLAIADYEARLEHSTGDEEAYYCQFRLGCLLIEKKYMLPEGADHLMSAYLSRTTRIESLAALRYYIDLVIEGTEYPHEDLTMVHRNLYKGGKDGS